MAKHPNFPSIRGFEIFPEGRLLKQRVDFDGPVGIAYERCIGYTKLDHSHDRITISFARGASHSFIRVFPEAKNFKLNEELVHVMAKDHRHEQGSYSSVYDTFALFVTPEHFAAHLRGMGVDESDARAFIASTQVLRRGAVLQQAIGRYFFCRVLEENPSPSELAYLESLVMTEIFAVAQKRKPGTARPSPVRADRAEAPEITISSGETSILRAIEFIESHLFEKLDVPGLVKAARTSQATLFRLFKREVKASPLAYVRNRRLDEAKSLLKTGQYQVGDVALLVGYEDLSSFSKAFKSRFKCAPSLALPKTKSASP